MKKKLNKKIEEIKKNNNSETLINNNTSIVLLRKSLNCITYDKKLQE